MRKVRLRINTYGRSARDGADVLKVIHGERLLKRAGYRVVRRAGGAVFLKAPSPDASAKPVVEVELPSRAEVEARAAELHRGGKPWEGEMGDWPASYTPRLGEGAARFHVGEAAVWSVHVIWDQGDAKPPTVDELDANVIAAEPAAPASARLGR